MPSLTPSQTPYHVPNCVLSADPLSMLSSTQGVSPPSTPSLKPNTVPSAIPSPTPSRDPSPDQCQTPSPIPSIQYTGLPSY